MTRIVGPGYARFAYGGTVSRDFAVFSPNGRRFVFVLRRGDLEHNRNVFSMFLFGVKSDFGFTPPKVLVSFSSSSNREAIKDPTWLDDSDTILFLGERPGETTQLYSVRGNTGRVKRITNSKTSLTSYASNGRGAIAFAAEKQGTDLINPRVVRSGLRVSREVLPDLISGHFVSNERELYVGRDRVPKRLTIHDEIFGDPVDLFISPDGRHLVVKTNVTDIPEIWSQYKDESLRSLVLRKPPKGFPTWVFRYELIDLQTGESRFLLDSPVSLSGSEVAWAGDSRSIVLTGVYLPLNVENAVERAKRQTARFVVQVKLPSLEIIKVADEDLEFLGWDGQTGLLLKSRSLTSAGAPEAVKHYAMKGGQWELTKSNSPRTGERQPKLTVEQDLNIPPRVVAVNPKTRQETVLLDLNPQFKELAFGKVEEVRWAGPDGHEVAGALYLPPDYAAGKQYPLLIQTHGYDPRGFWIDGPFTTAFAAQALAGKEIVVLQVPNSHASMHTPDEAPKMMETYEKGIDYLSRQGVIDRERIGIVGFSRTGLYVRYLLTHSQYHFAVAVIADGFDDGYHTYLAFATSSPYFVSEVEELIGAAPFGEGLPLWLQRSSGFLLNKVEVPVQIQANSPASLLANWDWFSGLRQLQKPVDMLYLPSGSHILEKPWERVASQQGVVDWVCFWLKGEEDPSPLKTEQYIRWRSLRELEKHATKKHSRTDSAPVQ